MPPNEAEKAPASEATPPITLAEAAPLVSPAFDNKPEVERSTAPEGAPEVGPADDTVVAPEQPEADASLPPVSLEVQGSGLDPEDLKVPPMFKPAETGTIGGPGSEERDKMMAAAAQATAAGFAASVTQNQPGDPSKQILPPPPEIPRPTEAVQAAEKIIDLPPLPPAA